MLENQSSKHLSKEKSKGSNRSRKGMEEETQEECEEDNILQEMELDSIKIDLPTLITAHGETHLIDLAEDRLLQLQKKIGKGKSKLGTSNPNQISTCI